MTPVTWSAVFNKATPPPSGLSLQRHIENPKPVTNYFKTITLYICNFPLPWNLCKAKTVEKVSVLMFYKWRRCFPLKLPASRCHVIRSPRSECQQSSDARLQVFSPQLSTNWTATRRHWSSDSRHYPFKAELSAELNGDFLRGKHALRGGSVCDLGGGERLPLPAVGSSSTGTQA